MRISTKLKIAVLVPVVIAFVIGSALFFSFKTLQETQRKERAIHRVISGMNDLSGLVGEYVIYHEDRPLQQFLLEHKSILKFIGTIRLDDPEQRQILQNIRRDMELMKGSFLRLVSNRERVRPAEEDVFTKEVEGRLAGRLLVWSRDVVSHASYLERLVVDEMVVAQKKISFFVFALIVATTLFLTFLLIGITRSINASLGRLRQGAEMIGAGDLDYRFAMPARDEIGEFALSFDRMTGQLQALTVSRDTLQQEIDERRKFEAALRESFEKLRIIADFTYDWEYWITEENRFVYVSPSCERITGYSREEFIETPDLYSRIVHPDDRDRVMKHLREPEVHRDLYEMEFRIMRRDGRERWIAHACVTIIDENGKILGRRACNRDITERKLAVEELERSRRELERRVQDRTAELEMKNKELEDFSFIASHDLQEPLRKIRAFGNLLVLKADSSLDEQSRDYIDRMQRAAARMQVLLRSLLDYSRVTRKEEPLRPVELRQALEKSLDNLEILVREKGAQVEVQDLPVVQAVPAQMIQLFQNLIGNAIKFQTPDEIPRIRVYSRAVQDPGPGREKIYRIYVEDNGIGFDEEKYLDKIFEPFQRLHRREEFEGVGIGLGICKKIVERHGWSITARSTPGKGSTFIITLPGKRNEGDDQ